MHSPSVTSKLDTVRKCLGPPAWECDRVLVYQGDCVELMRRLPEGCVDLTVTSPPYNIGKVYEQAMPMDIYIDWCADWINRVYRITSLSGAFWLNLGYVKLPDRAKAIPLPYLMWQRIPFYLIQEIVWNYGAGVASKLMFSPRNEKWLWYVKNQYYYKFNLDDVRDPNVKYPNQKKNGKIRVNPLGKNPSDVWQIPKVTTGEGMTGQRASPERTAHPAQFPEAVIERIILSSSDPGDLVLDPFGGSGTTASVALSNDRPCVLFEILPEYVSIAARRIERARLRNSVSQSYLFGEIE